MARTAQLEIADLAIRLQDGGMSERGAQREAERIAAVIEAEAREEEERADRDMPRSCDEYRCPHPPVWQVQHVEYADHLKPLFACGHHLARIVRSIEYGEGDEMYVRRVRFEC